MQSLLPHELGHIRYLQGIYSAWKVIVLPGLDEGVAMYQEKLKNAKTLSLKLRQAPEEKGLFPRRSCPS